MSASHADMDQNPDSMYDRSLESEVRKANWLPGPLSNIQPTSCLMLIRLFQQATSCSVGTWLGRRFPRLCADSNRNLPAKRLATSTWLPAAGRMGSCVRAVATDAPMNS